MTSLPVQSLLDAPLIPQDGIRHVNFFNGRLLTAGDLRSEQQAELQISRQLGRAVGSGVVHGLEVRLLSDGTNGKSPTVAVSGGLAINDLGQAIELPLSSVTVTLARQAELLPLNAGLFEDCEPPTSGLDTVGEGAYVFAITAASAFRDQAPMVPVGSNGKSTACGDAYAVEGAAFRLVELPPTALSGVNLTTRNQINDLMASADDLTLTAAARRAKISMLRNLLAHVCFGTEEVARFRADPWGRAGGISAFQAYGAIDTMRASGDLRPCDVPLGLIFWSRTGLKYVDMWAVRRRPIPPSNDSLWPLAQGQRRLIEAEATFLQFEDHVESLLSSEPSQAALSALHAADYFRYLPAAGLLPMQGSATTRGLDYLNFTLGLTVRERITIEGSRWAHLLQTSLEYLPMDLETHEFIWTYLVRENVQAVAAVPFQPPQLSLAFSSGDIPFQGDAQFDLARWDFSNYGPGVRQIYA